MLAQGGGRCIALTISNLGAGSCWGVGVQRQALAALPRKTAPLPIVEEAKRALGPV